MTREQLARFIGTRTNSHSSTNLQFQIDAERCGFRLAELGDAREFRRTGFLWLVKPSDAPALTLIEFGGALYASDEPPNLVVLSLLGPFLEAVTRL